MGGLIDLDTRFKFGENWSQFEQHINCKAIENARKGLEKLISPQEIKDKKILDIGSGSGLHSLVALIQGAKEVYAIDIDPISVRTTRKVLSKYYEGNNWKCEEMSVFDLSPGIHGNYDIVYAWGVLHHTGDMYRALLKAMAMVAPERLFLVALYRKTKMCNFWKIEKKFYSKSSSQVQRLIRKIYMALFFLDYRLRTGKKSAEYIRDYSESRGMNYYNDVHDWLGGYPYESVNPNKLKLFMKNNGFDCRREFLMPSSLGFFGSGNDEFAFQRR